MDALQDEVESLEAILMEDVTITRDQSGLPQLIETTIFPTVEDDGEQQYICVTLQVLPTPGYPEVSPEFRLLKPRGLDDVRLNNMKLGCAKKLCDMLGSPVVFDLIETIREQLSGSNLPSGQCVICLYGFTAGDEFTKTECFHYLHSYCLGRHFIALRRNHQEELDKLPAWQRKTAAPFQAGCPVCREPIKDDATDSLKCAMPPAELHNAPDFQLTAELKELQRRMTALYLQQKSRGAIIDVENDCGATAVISIESEEDLRRQLQRKKKQQGSQNGQAATVSVGELPTPSRESRGARNSVAVVSTASQLTANTDAAGSNNAANHNRRHYRGGRRHQQHHHHHNHNQRDRERHENQHSSHSTAAAASTPAAAAGSKQPKGGQAGCGAHAR